MRMCSRPARERALMASITIRQLDESLKQQLRLRAASHGRPMEDEVRTIPRAGAVGPAEAPPARAATRRNERVAESPVLVSKPIVPAGHKRVLLIIGGGIAAYKSLDLIRRLRERHMAVRCILTAAAQEFVTPLAAGGPPGGRGVSPPFCSTQEARRGGTPPSPAPPAIAGGAAAPPPTGQKAGGA